MQTMLKAKIIDNKCYCPICEQRDYKIKDYKQVKHDGESYTEFIVRCKCKTEFQFCSKITIEKEEHFVFNENEIEEIEKEEVEI